MTKPEMFITPGFGEKLRDLLHYSQAVKIGDRVEISGQGGWNDNLEIPEAIEDEIEQAFENVERTLATAGASWKNVVHVNSYHVGGFPRLLTKQFLGFTASTCPIAPRSGHKRALKRSACQQCASKSA